ncbi:MAG: mechanosensitive ion channel family protein [Gammaproteobacteria bacterium]|nr:mechanosensitive ion channel family protein [Gammaproteobacteria bacterium]
MSTATVIELPSWMPEPIHTSWQFLSTWPIVGAGIIVLVSLLVAWVVVGMAKRLVGRITTKTHTDYDDRLLKILQRPVFLTVLFIGLVAATQTLGLPEGFENGTTRVLNSILILVWMSASFRLVGVLLDLLGRDGRFNIIQERTIPLFEISSKVLIFAIGIYILLKAWDIDATAWLASAGVVGIALGFAAKDTLANLFSGFFIVADAPYRIGDYIVLDSGERGKVTAVGIRSTRMLTRDDIEITLPNAMIAAGKIINEAGGPTQKARIRVPVGAAYGSDVDQVCAVLEKVANDHAEVCASPTPRVRMRAFGASSLDFELLCWAEKPELRGRLLHELHMAVYKAFDEAGIEIPYSKQDVFIKEMPGRAA